VSAAKQVFYRAWDALHYLSGNGSWTLSEHERLIVNAAIRHFPEDVQRLLEAQLHQRYFVERMSQGRFNVLRLYDDNSELRIQDPRFGDMLVVVRLSVDGNERDAHVVFLRGHLFSVEFRDKSSFYANRSVEVRDVKVGSPKQTYTRAIDRLEHGKDDGSPK
jgi:hypothetical protein